MRNPWLRSRRWWSGLARPSITKPNQIYDNIRSSLEGGGVGIYLSRRTETVGYRVHSMASLFENNFRLTHAQQYTLSKTFKHDAARSESWLNKHRRNGFGRLNYLHLRRIGRDYRCYRPMTNFSQALIHEGNDHLLFEQSRIARPILQ